jgi:hypothetical protein
MVRDLTEIALRAAKHADLPWTAVRPQETIRTAFVAVPIALPGQREAPECAGPAVAYRAIGW